MSGIGGWLGGAVVPSGDHLLAVMSEHMAVERVLPVHAVCSDGAGMVITGPPHAAAVHSTGAQTIGIFGRPRWTADARGETGLDSICRKFLDEYRASGSAALRLLHGEFSLVMIDREAGEALLAVDRFGIRNLVYQADPAGFIFGSSCDIVRLHPGADHEI